MSEKLLLCEDSVSVRGWVDDDMREVTLDDLAREVLARLDEVDNGKG